MKHVPRIGLPFSPAATLSAAVVACAAVAAAVVVIPLAQRPHIAGWDPDQRVVTAIQQGDWPTVGATVDSGREAPAPARLVRAHALLAGNHNNEAICQFLSISTDDLKAWQAWTRDFARQYPNQAVGAFLAGDAEARLGHWDDALVSLNAALEQAPELALAHAARGTVYASREEWSEALADFAQATTSKTPLAEAHHARGTTYLLMQSGGPGALAAFEAALAVNPDFALALNGRASARLVVGAAGTEADGAAATAQAEADFNSALANAQCDAVEERIRSNVAAILDQRDPNYAPDGADSAGRGAGTTVTQKTSSSHGFHVDLGAGLKIPHFTDVHAGLGYDFKNPSTTTTETNSRSTGGHSGKPGPGGAEADFSQAHVDAGQWWTYVSHFGLAYPTSQSR